MLSCSPWSHGLIDFSEFLWFDNKICIVWVTIYLSAIQQIMTLKKKLIMRLSNGYPVMCIFLRIFAFD